eukprot:Lithocolla_globosa_v1_NODE_9299_length_723_cov_23.410180.p1 type:complete len:190 gc:universal NODE_9299_length_723_cov_23.410180:589-20(-)
MATTREDFTTALQSQEGTEALLAYIHRIERENSGLKQKQEKIEEQQKLLFDRETLVGLKFSSPQYRFMFDENDTQFIEIFSDMANTYRKVSALKKEERLLTLKKDCETSYKKLLLNEEEVQKKYMKVVAMQQLLEVTVSEQQEKKANQRKRRIIDQQIRQLQNQKKLVSSSPNRFFPVNRNYFTVNFPL